MLLDLHLGEEPLALPLALLGCL